jgi:hypothetical protein
MKPNFPPTQLPTKAPPTTKKVRKKKEKEKIVLAFSLKV